MPDNNGTADTAPNGKADWIELFRGGRGVYTVLSNLGIGLHALDIFIIITIMPTVVTDIGGLAYYTWTSMLYMVGSITGAACGGYMRIQLGRRRGYVIAGIVLIVGTVGCAIPPDMPTLLGARVIKGFGGGLVIAQSMALISELYDNRLRTRMLALVTTTWSVAALLGPAIGGVFAEIGWWRGAFWATLPFAVVFVWASWRTIPPSPPSAISRPLPLMRLSLLTLGVICVGMTGQMDSIPAMGVMLFAALALVWFTFRVDATSDHALFPSRPLSFFGAVGLSYWVFFLISVTHSSLLIFTPLFLQVLHGLSPLYVGYLSLVFSLAWTAGAIAVSGWTGRWERYAAAGGMGLAAVGIALMTREIVSGSMTVVTVYFMVIGLGIGATNVLMTSWGMMVARKGEESVTASSMPMIRAIGVAFGAALAGLVANAAGLGQGTEREIVANAAIWVMSMSVVQPALAALIALRFLTYWHGGHESVGAARD